MMAAAARRRVSSRVGGFAEFGGGGHGAHALVAGVDLGADLVEVFEEGSGLNAVGGVDDQADGVEGEFEAVGDVVGLELVGDEEVDDAVGELDVDAGGEFRGLARGGRGRWSWCLRKHEPNIRRSLVFVEDDLAEFWCMKVANGSCSHTVGVSRRGCETRHATAASSHVVSRLKARSSTEDDGHQDDLLIRDSRESPTMGCMKMPTTRAVVGVMLATWARWCALFRCLRRGSWVWGNPV